MLTILAALIYKEQRRANREQGSMSTEDSTVLFSYAFLVLFLWPLLFPFFLDRYAQRPGIGLIISLAFLLTLFPLGWAFYFVYGFIFLTIAMAIVFSAAMKMQYNEENSDNSK